MSAELATSIPQPAEAAGIAIRGRMALVEIGMTSLAFFGVNVSPAIATPDVVAAASDPTPMTPKQVRHNIARVTGFEHSMKVVDDSLNRRVIDINGKCSTDPDHPWYKAYRDTRTQARIDYCNGASWKRAHEEAPSNHYAKPLNRIANHIAESVGVGMRKHGTATHITANGWRAEADFKRPTTDTPKHPVKSIILRAHKKPVIHRY